MNNEGRRVVVEVREVVLIGGSSAFVVAWNFLQ